MVDPSEWPCGWHSNRKHFFPIASKGTCIVTSSRKVLVQSCSSQHRAAGRMGDLAQTGEVVSVPASAVHSGGGPCCGPAHASPPQQDPTLKSWGDVVPFPAFPSPGTYDLAPEVASPHSRGGNALPTRDRPSTLPSNPASFRWASKCGPQTRASAAPGTFLEMGIFRPHPQTC